MNPALDPFNRFLRAVHRRQALLRIAEGCGLGILAGCAAAAVLAGVLLWRGGDAGPVVALTLGIGALAGAVCGIARRPTSLAAASEADRQLGAADLLATAWAIQRERHATASDPMRTAVLAMASARCATSSPSMVILHRLGFRAWSSIALAVAFVSTLAALSSHSPEAIASPSVSRGAIAPSNAAHRPLIELQPDTSRRQPRVEQNPGDSRAPEPVSAESADPSAPDSTHVALPTDTPNRSASDGSAGNTSKPDVPVSRVPLAPPNATPRELTNTDPAGRPTGGAGRASADPTTDGATAGGTLAPEPVRVAPPPWHQTSWPSAVEAALQAVKGKRVPDRSRDLVREYFEPGSTEPASSGQ